MKYVLLIFFIGISTVNSQNNWKETTESANALETESKWEDALALRKTAIQLAANENKNTKGYLQALEKITQAELNLRISTDYKQAYELMQKGVEGLIASKSDPKVIAQTYRRLGMIAHNQLYSIKDAYDSTSKSIEYHQKSKTIDTLVLFKTLHSAIVLSRELGEFKESLNNFEKYKEIFNKSSVKDTNGLGSVYRDISMLYSQRFLNIPPKEYLYIEKAKNVFESSANPDLQYLFSVYIALGDVEKRLGNFKSAEGFFNKAIQLYRTNKEKTQSFRKGNLGNKFELNYYDHLRSMYALQNDKEKVISTLEECKKLKKHDAIEQNIYANAISQVGMFFSDKDPDIALKYFKEALAINKTLKQFDNSLEYEINIANAYFYKGNYDEVLKVVAKVNQAPKMPGFLQKRVSEVKTRTLFASSKFEEAIIELQKLISLITPRTDFSIQNDDITAFESGYVISDAFALTRVADEIPNDNENLQNLKENLYFLALKQFEYNVGNLQANDKLKDDFNKIIVGLLEIGAKRNFSEQRNNLLLSTMENIESRFLINKLLLKRSLASNKNVNAYLEKEQFLRSNITFLNKKLISSKDETLKQQIFEEEQKLKKLEQDFIGKNPKYASFLQKKYTFKDFKLPKNQMYIKFKVINNEVYKITVNQEVISYTKIENYKNLKTTIAGYLESLTDVTSSIDGLKSEANNIYNILFPNGLANAQKIVILPDDILYYLPFELLVNDNDYLIKNHTFSYAVGWSYLDENLIKQSTSNTEDIAFFAPSYNNVSEMNAIELRGSPIVLKGAQEEVLGISKLISGRMYIGDEALKSRFKASTKDVAVIHLSMHSFLNDENPELSSLAFATKEEDSELYISELYGYTFNSDLAVLSACNTGVGGFKDGGSLISMSHAFTFAGIPSTVSSLWSAPDQSTKNLMFYFYQHLKEGKSKSEALKNAKLDYLNTTKNADLQHPFYWAGFVMYGNDNPIDFKTNYSQLYIILGSVAAILMVLGCLYVIKKRKQSQV